VLDDVVASEVISGIETVAGKEVEPEIALLVDRVKACVDDLLDAKIIDEEPRTEEEEEEWLVPAMPGKETEEEDDWDK
jgi:hypothetical protein